MRCIGCRACFEARLGCAGPPLSMTTCCDGFKKMAHPEAPRKARPRRLPCLHCRNSARGFAIAKSRQLVEQLLCLRQIGGVEAFGEPAINWCQ